MRRASGSFRSGVDVSADVPRCLAWWRAGVQALPRRARPAAPALVAALQGSCRGCRWPIVCGRGHHWAGRRRSCKRLGSPARRERGGGSARVAVACPCLPTNMHAICMDPLACLLMDPYTHAPCVIARNSVSGFPSACRRCHKGRAHVFVHPLGLGKMPSRQIELKIKLIALKSWDAFQVGGRAHTL